MIETAVKRDAVVDAARAGAAGLVAARVAGGGGSGDLDVGGGLGELQSLTALYGKIANLLGGYGFSEECVVRRDDRGAGGDADLRCRRTYFEGRVGADREVDGDDNAVGEERPSRNGRLNGDVVCAEKDEGDGVKTFGVGGAGVLDARPPPSWWYFFFFFFYICDVGAIDLGVRDDASAHDRLQFLRGPCYSRPEREALRDKVKTAKYFLVLFSMWTPKNSWGRQEQR